MSEDKRIVLDVRTMLYCCECLEDQARQMGGANRTVVGKPLEGIAQNWRDLIEECADLRESPKPQMNDRLLDMQFRGGWQGEAATSILIGIYGDDPDYVPRYRVPNRRFFWEFWKPKWCWSGGVSRRQMGRVQEEMDSAYAIAIDARRAETGTGSVEDESAAIAQEPDDPPTQGREEG